MKKQLWEIGLLSALIVLFLVFPTSGTAQETYFEEFATNQYKDPLNTTAAWDTAAGELGLYSFQPAIVGSYDTPDIDIRVAISGDLAFVADYFAGLIIIDISDPGTPTFVSSYTTPAAAFDVAIAGDYS